MKFTTNDYVVSSNWGATTKRRKIVEMYMDYVNNFLTVIRFAEYYDISKEKAYRVISTGKQIIDTCSNITEIKERPTTLF